MKRCKWIIQSSGDTFDFGTWPSTAGRSCNLSEEYEVVVNGVTYICFGGTVWSALMNEHEAMHFKLSTSGLSIRKAECQI